MRHVERDGYIGVHSVCRGHGAAGADFLLDGCSCDEIAIGASGLCEALEHTQGDPHAHLVVERARNSHVVSQAFVSHAEGDDVAHMHELLDLFAGKPQVDDELIDGGNVFAFVSFD